MRVLIYRDKKKPFSSYEETYYRSLKNYVSQLNNDTVVSDVEEDFDIAHFIGLEFKSTLLKIKKEKQCPIVVTYNIVRKTKKEFEDENEIKIPSDEIKVLNSIDRIIAMSQTDKDVMIRNGIETPIDVIGAGTKPQKFYQMNELELKAFSQYASLNKTDSYAICVLNNKNLKDVEMMIDLANEFKNIKFFLFTKKISFFKMPRKAYFMLKNPPVNVKRITLVDEDLYKSALMNARFFIVPSDASSTSMIIFDAMVTKTPIFAIYSQTIDDTLINKKNAYVSYSVENMKNDIHDFIDGKLPSLVDNAYQYAKEDSFELVAQKIKKLYDSLILLNKE